MSKFNKKIIIAIDGPSGAGKSTIGKLLSLHFGYPYLDTGALYRAIAYKILNEKISLEDENNLYEICKNANIQIVQDKEKGIKIFLDNKDITEEIRTPQISMLASKVSAIKSVRSALLDIQRRIAEKEGAVVEGRDIGTVVFPDADFKFFLIASPEERGKRRYLELKEKNIDVSLEDTIKSIIKRDEDDSTREIAPLKKAEDAIEIDSTNMGIEEVLSYMIEIIESNF